MPSVTGTSEGFDLSSAPSARASGRLEDLLRAVAHAPARKPPSDVVESGARWGMQGRYVIGKLLGRGGMGAVYSAVDALLGRAVALKVIDAGHCGDGAIHRSRLLREARVAARIEHERIARIYDVGEHDDGTLFVAMELVRGVNLRTWMDDRVPSAREIVGIVRQIAEGLAALHGRGVFHRDLKPENVMLSSGGVRLLDFGLARHDVRLETDDTESPSITLVDDEREGGALSGTPGYMAPEQCLCEPLDARVDVFALGVILYELVTGARPFAGDGSVEVFQATIKGTCDLDGVAWHRVPPRLREVAARALARDPADRFIDGIAMLVALHDLESEVPLSEDLGSIRPAGRFEVTTRNVLGGLPALTDAQDPPETGEVTIRTPPPAAFLIDADHGEVTRRSNAPPGSPWWKKVILPAALVATFALAAPIAEEEHPIPRALSLPPPPDMALIDDDLRASGADGVGAKRVAPFYLDRHEVTNLAMVDLLNRLADVLVVVPDDVDPSLRHVRFRVDAARAPGGREGLELLVLQSDLGGIDVSSDQTFRSLPGREQWPVNQVTWWGARRYCATRGKRLPSDEEWSAAAGGRGRTFPWGESSPRCGEVGAASDACVVTSPAIPGPATLVDVGEARQDVTVERVHDLGGNVSEWVETPYDDWHPVRGSPGAEMDTLRVVRGGSLFSATVRSDTRDEHVPGYVASDLGFRCALDVTK